MIKRRSIIIFGDDWGRYPSTTQHIGRILAQENQVFWIGSLGLRRVKIADLKRILNKFKSMVRNEIKNSGNTSVTVLHPLVIPLHNWKIIRCFNRLSLQRIIAKKVKSVDPPLLLSASPVIGNLVGSLKESSAHYICLDDYSLFEGAFRSINKLESELLSKVDSAFFVSDILISKFKTKTRRQYFLPQGVDVNHFQTPVKVSIPDMENISQPIIGFFGFIAPWIDLALMRQCAINYPKVSFVLIGKMHSGIKIEDMPGNLHYLGEVPYDKLPNFARYFKVGLIPFLMNNLTLAANPLKLMEYFSLGIPVVSTALPEVKKFQDYMYIASDRDDFISKITMALNESDEKKKSDRVALSQKYSWKAIVEKMSEIIDEIEREKYHQ